MSEQVNEGEKAFKVEINGPGLNLAREVNEDVALSLITVVLGKHNKSRVIQSLDDADEDKDKVELSIGEYMSRVGASNNRERIAAILQYLSIYHNKNNVHKDVIPDWFQRAREPAPKNLSRDLNTAVSEKLIAEDFDNPDHYYITKTGRQKLTME